MTLRSTAQQVSGVRADRELPVVWAVAKGSFRNKAILGTGSAGHQCLCALGGDAAVDGGWGLSVFRGFPKRSPSLPTARPMQGQRQALRE